MGRSVAGTGRTPCDDGIACTMDGCSEEEDDCQNVPNDALCTGSDVLLS